jgi:imidazolonepropionase
MNQDAAKKIAIVNIGQLVTLAGAARPRVGAEMRELAMLTDAALLVEDGRVCVCGYYADLRGQIDADTIVIDAGGRLVTPGFVDAHTHLVFAGNRAAEFERRIGGATYQEIAAAGGGIQSTVTLTRAATEDELLAQARKHRDWMLRGGTTTFEAKSGYGLNHETELRMLRVLARLDAEGPMRIVPTLLAAHTVPREMADRRDDYLHGIIDELIPEVAAKKLARYCDAFCDDHAFTVVETRQVLEAAKQHGFGLRIHAEQFRSGTGAALGAELKAATVDHLETVTEETLRLLLSAGVQPVLLPASVFCLGRDRYPPARTMIEMGLPVVIATDFNPGSSPAPSMPFTMSLACIHMRMMPAEVLTAATINAAWSLGLGSEIGSLEPGKSADFLIHECDDYRELAYYVAAPARPRVFVAGHEVTL